MRSMGESGTEGGVPSCELCEAARFTHWYFEDDVCWVADCESCGTPMVVWQRHGTEPPAHEVEHMLGRLTAAAERRFGAGVAQIDRVMRQVPEHFHAHARDVAWLSRRWSDPPSRYSGIGTDRQTVGDN